MVIRSQAAQKWAEGSETRSYDPTVLCMNLNVEYQGYEGPRAPRRQAVQQVRQAAAAHRVLQVSQDMQNLLSATIPYRLSAKSGHCADEGYRISAGQQQAHQAIHGRLVCKKSFSRAQALQEIQRAG